MIYIILPPSRSNHIEREPFFYIFFKQYSLDIYANYNSELDVAIPAESPQLTCPCWDTCQIATLAVVIVSINIVM